MRTSEMIKSKFWRARDVEGQPPRVLTIADVTEELLGRGARQDVKCFLWFNESPKGLQLNKTRVTILEAAFGPDSDLWVGQRVRLSFDPTVEFGGRAVGGVRLQTPPGVVYQAAGAGLAGWGDPAGTASGRPPAPVWDEKRQQWIVPQAPPLRPVSAPARPPPPVWNEATQTWETVNPATGEIAAPVHQRAPTISERVNAGRSTDDDRWGPADAAPAATGAPEFDDDIPF